MLEAEGPLLARAFSPTCLSHWTPVCTIANPTEKKGTLAKMYFGSRKRGPEASFDVKPQQQCAAPTAAASLHHTAVRSFFTLSSSASIVGPQNAGLARRRRRLSPCTALGTGPPLPPPSPSFKKKELLLFPHSDAIKGNEGKGKQEQQRRVIRQSPSFVLRLA